MKNKPIKCGLKFYILAESASGYVHHAKMHCAAASELDDTSVETKVDGMKTFDCVIGLLTGAGLKDEYTFLDQGYIVSQLNMVCS